MSKNYFTAETEKWIIEYNRESDLDRKNKIFSDYLYFPFYKLAENIINTFKFYNTDSVSVEDLKTDAIAMLLEEGKIAKFDPTKIGKSGQKVKAFSYFGTIIKRWLIASTNLQQILKDRQDSFKDPNEFFLEEYDKDLSEILDTPISLSDFIDSWVKDVYSNLETLFPKELDRKIADAVLTIFRTRKQLQVFKKKAFYIYIREITKCETPHVTQVLTVLKASFQNKLQKIINSGYSLSS